MPYSDPNILTPEQLANDLVSIYEANPDYRLVGSLGRAVLYQSYLGNSLIEFDERGQLPLQGASGRPRDLDLIQAPNHTETSTVFPADRSCFDSPEARIYLGSAGWRLQSDRRRYDEPIHEDVMARVYGETVHGIRTQTLSAQTHLALYGIRGVLRRKDDIPARLLHHLIAAHPTTIPTKHYQPFHELASMKDSGAVASLSTLYRRYAPETVVRHTGGILVKIRRSVGHKNGS